METTIAQHPLQMDKALEFLLAGKAIFTIKSKESGKHFTYRIRKPKDADREIHFVSLLTGSDNESSYSFFATIFDKKEYRHGKKAKISDTAEGVIAFRWFLRNLLAGTVNDRVELFHEGKCCACGRKLTHPESVKTGIGPECSGRIHKQIT